MSLFCLKPLSGFLWLSVRAFSRPAGTPLLGLPPLLWPHGPSLTPEEALPSPTLSSPSAWSHHPGSLWHGFILTPDVAPLVGPPQSLFPRPVYFLHIIWLLWWLVYCLSPLFGIGASQATGPAVWGAPVGSVKLLWGVPHWMGTVGCLQGLWPAVM